MTRSAARIGDRRLRSLLVLAPLVVAGAIGLVSIAARRFESAIDDRVTALLSDADAASDEGIADTELTDLPPPVERYFRAVFEGERRDVRAVRLRQRGEFRLGGPDAPWRPMDATQYVTTRPPGFVWDATIDVFPLLPVRVVDLYARGEGVLRAKLRSAIAVASAGPNPEMNAGELTRYLAEAVWYPTALLPGRGVEWEAIDDRSARATLSHEGATASLVYHFDDRGLVERVTTERYRQEDDSDAPWTGYFRNYEERDGLRVPTEADVEWNLPEGDLPYWRASVCRIDHAGAEGIAELG